MRKKTINRILHGLTHPVMILAVLVLLVNDWLLKQVSPSWWTGKLSDAVMVVLAPFLTMIVLALFFPKRWLHWLPWFGFGIPLGGFVLGKTIPGVNAFIYSMMNNLFPFPVHFVFDPSDLICLVFVPVGVVLWKYCAQPKMHQSWRWVWVPFMLLAALGDAVAPEYGVVCVTANDSGVWAKSEYFDQVFLSVDGGLSWQNPEQPIEYPAACSFSHNEIGDQIVFEDSDGGQWRFIAGEKIEFSANGGNTWTESLSLNQIGEADLAYIRQQQSNFVFIHGPLEITEDPESGNIIAAMGQEGILVHRVDAGWQWISLGGYGPDVSLQSAGLSGLIVLLLAEFLLSLFFGIYLISLLNLTVNRRWWRIVKVVLAFLGWAATMIFSPAIADPYISSSLWVIAIPAAAFWALLCLADDIISWVKNPSTPWLFMVALGFLVSIINIFIFIFWGVNWIKHYPIALWIVFLISLITAFGGTILARRKYSRVEEVRNETRS